MDKTSGTESLLPWPVEFDNCGFNLRSKIKDQIEIRNCADGSWVIEARKVAMDRGSGLLWTEYMLDSPQNFRVIILLNKQTKRLDRYTQPRGKGKETKTTTTKGGPIHQAVVRRKNIYCPPVLHPAPQPQTLVSHINSELSFEKANGWF